MARDVSKKNKIIALATYFFTGNLVLKIAVGIVFGIVLAIVWPAGAKSAILLGDRRH